MAPKCPDTPGTPDTPTSPAGNGTHNTPHVHLEVYCAAQGEHAAAARAGAGGPSKSNPGGGPYSSDPHPTVGQISFSIHTRAPSWF